MTTVSTNNLNKIYNVSGRFRHWTNNNCSGDPTIDEVFNVVVTNDIPEQYRWVNYTNKIGGMGYVWMTLVPPKFGGYWQVTVDCSPLGTVWSTKNYEITPIGIYTSLGCKDFIIRSFRLDDVVVS